MAELDLEAGTIVLACGKFQPEKHPTAVFEKQVKAELKPLEESLLDLAEQVAEHGFDPDHGNGAALALLLRTPPVSGPAALRQPEEATLDAAKRIARALECGVLPIQGPPGAGKTYTGARMILDLDEQGYRIGVTAVSHKVIDNLLCEVHKAAIAQGSMLRLLHKESGDPPPGVVYVGTPADARAAVKPGSVVGGTVWLWCDPASEASLDYLFIDEAGQMSLAHALAAARCARNLVLLDDPQQLEQPQRGAHPEGADVATLVHVIGKGTRPSRRPKASSSRQPIGSIPRSAASLPNFTTTDA